MATLTASPELRGVLARDLSRDISKRIVGLDKALRAIPRTGTDSDCFLDYAIKSLGHTGAEIDSFIFALGGE